MSHLENLCNALIQQIDTMMCNDNFNNNNGEFDKNILDFECKRTDALIRLSKQVIGVAKVVKVAAEYNIPK